MRVTVQGASADKILMPLTRAHTTFEKALAVREFLREQGLQSVIIVTSSHHLRRAQFTFERVFPGTGVTLSFPASKKAAFPIDTWWKGHVGRRLVIKECLGLVNHWPMARSR
jgi:uncharacterized SAM-binding protein YcdF (DUF218 family)